MKKNNIEIGDYVECTLNKDWENTYGLSYPGPEKGDVLKVERVVDTDSGFSLGFKPFRYFYGMQYFKKVKLPDCPELEKLLSKKV